MFHKCSKEFPSIRFRISMWMLLITAFGRQPAKAMDLYALDLDSLAFSASVVAEGRIAAGAPTDDAFNVQIDAVYIGDVTAGSTVSVIDRGWYRTDHPLGRFQPGDMLFLFLARADPKQQRELPLGCLIPVDSGIKLIRDGNVYGFEQIGNPGGYELMTPKYFPNAATTPLADFRKNLKLSMERSAGWKDAWKRPAVTSEVPQLLKLMKDRRDVPCDDSRHADAVGHAAALRLVSLFDPPSICEAIDADPHQSRLLSNGFNSPEGREFLLKKVADPATPPLVRRSLAGDLAGDYLYTSRMVNGPDGNLTVSLGPPSPTNGDYLKRCALLAVAKRVPPEVCLRILESLEFAARWFQSEKGPGVHADLANAVAVLRPFYAGRASDGAKYLVEQIIRDIDPDAYTKLGSADGGIIAIVEVSPSNENDPWNKTPGHLSLTLRYEWPKGFDGVDSMQLVMESLVDNKIYRLREGDFVPEQHGETDQDCAAGIQTEVPATLPHGKYHVYYQLLNKGAAVGHSYGFDIDG